MKIKKKLNLNHWLRKFYTSKFYQLIYPNNENLKKKIFTSIYKSNHWAQSDNTKNEIVSVSGPGSNINDKSLIQIKHFKKIIEDLKIKSILDMPCGDFLWMDRVVDKTNIKYLGIDIVKEIIDENKLKYKKDNINFKCVDIVNFTNSEKFDLILIRDLFIHLKNEDILKIIKNVRRLNFKYIAVSNNTVEHNLDVNIGEHRKVNLLKDPYNLKKPNFILNDGESDKFIYFYKKKDFV